MTRKKTSGSRKTKDYKIKDNKIKDNNIRASVENEVEARFLVPKLIMKPHLATCKKLTIQQFYIPLKNQARALQQIIALRPKAKEF